MSTAASKLRELSDIARHRYDGEVVFTADVVHALADLLDALHESDTIFMPEEVRKPWLALEAVVLKEPTP